MTRRWTVTLSCALVLALGALAGCSGADSVLSGKSGNFRLVMTSSNAAPATRSAEHHGGDGALDRLQAAEARLSSVLARNLDGQLIDVSLELPVAVDLLGLVADGSFSLPVGSLPPGMYDQVVVVMNKLSLTMIGGTLVEVTPPGGGWTSIVRVDPFEVADGEVTTVTIHFRPASSFFMIGDQVGFSPDFDGDRHDGD